MADLTNLSDLSLDQLYFLAKTAEHTERFEGRAQTDMTQFMHAFASRVGRDLLTEERVALSVAYKNVIGVRRASWRVLTSIERKESQKGNRTNSQRAARYKEEVEGELQRLCLEILTLVELIEERGVDEQIRAFYCKMKGDYSRYLCEFLAAERATWVQRASEAYEQGISFAEADLQAFDPIRLGIVLNFAVFKYEIMGETEAACRLVKQARLEALGELGGAEAPSRDTTVLLQLLGDNLSLWSCAPAEEG
jgi:14-3-3 protein epsilon